ncbi:MAG: isoprenylcysteine carboxylmethyltransferase family protein [Gemmatimonadales bacterium]
MDLAKAARDPWVWGQFALLLVIGLGAPLLPRHVNLGRADSFLNRIDPDSIRWLGAAVMAVGGAIALWGIRALGSNLTPGTEPLPEAELITTGAYAHVRHPIYTGLVLLLTGYTLAWSNWTLGLVLGFIALQYFQAKASAEERWLLARFPGYKAYMRHVPRRVL